METSFHMALPYLSVTKTKYFYTKSICASLRRTTKNWGDINLFNHQITFIKAAKFHFNNPNYAFECEIFPSFYFRVIVDLERWKRIYAKLNTQNLEVVTKATFLKDKPGEHLSFL